MFTDAKFGKHTKIIIKWVQHVKNPQYSSHTYKIQRFLPFLTRALLLLWSKRGTAMRLSNGTWAANIVDEGPGRGETGHWRFFVGFYCTYIYISQSLISTCGPVVISNWCAVEKCIGGIGMACSIRDWLYLRSWRDAVIDMNPEGRICVHRECAP